MTCCIVLINPEATAASLPPLTTSSSDHSSATTGLLSQRNSDQSPKAGAGTAQGAALRGRPAASARLEHAPASHLCTLTAVDQSGDVGRAGISSHFQLQQSLDSCHPTGGSALGCANRPGLEHATASHLCTLTAARSEQGHGQSWDQQSLPATAVP